jgi:pimeloyl-ACP methyl ester carboxylesterase
MLNVEIDTGPGYKSDAARDAWNKDAHRTAANFEKHGLEPLQQASAERSGVSHRNAVGLAKAARGMLAQRNANVINSLPAISVPSLVVVGANDTPFLAASEYMTKKIPGCQKVVIPDAGHAVNIDQPERFNDAVLEFLSSVKNKSKL